MLKKMGVLLLFLLAAFALLAQDAADRRRERTPAPQPVVDIDVFSFTIVNNTGYPIRDVFVRRADSDWAENTVVNTMHRGQRIIIRLDHALDGSQLYDIRLVERDGDGYAKYGLTLAANETVTIEVTDMEF